MPEPVSLRLLLWKAGAVRCGVPIERLQEVLLVPNVTEIPGVAPPVRGVANVRGTLVTVVDCRALLHQPDGEAGQDLVLVHSGGRLVGLEVDEVEDLVTVAEGALHPTGAGAWQAVVDEGDPARVLDLDALLGPLFQE